VAPAVSCFGKLPFHREFLRLGLESAAGAWVAGWVEAAHAAWTRTGGAPGSSPLVRFAAMAETRLVVGVVRQSSDGLRRHPVTFFVEHGGAVAAERWHLVPLACVGTWDVLSAILCGTFTALSELVPALETGVPAPDLAGAEAAHAALLARGRAEGAWQAFTGARGEGARHLALNLVTVARAQRDARSPAEGVSMAVPLPDDPALAPGHGALWLELFSAATGAPAGRPALLLTTEPPRMVALYRPPEGRDLAAVLGSLAMAPIDDLSEAWESWPPADLSLAAAIERLVGDDGGPLGALPARLRAVAAS
jgi:hypothetical protein